MSFLSDILICLRFFSRLLVPTPPYAGNGMVGLAQAAAMVPVAGAIIAIVPIFVLLVLSALGLPPTLTAALAIAALVATTGALHEDAIADCADGFGGGATRERKLEIMRDSRIGAFGTCALILSLYIRVTALGIIAANSGGLACACVMAVAALSRTACLLPLVLLRPARSDGLGASTGRPGIPRVVTALGLAVVFALPTIAFGASPNQVLDAIIATLCGALAVCVIAGRQIGGQTGDVAGATQQIAELAALLTFAVAR